MWDARPCERSGAGYPALLRAGQDAPVERFLRRRCGSDTRVDAVEFSRACRREDPAPAPQMRVRLDCRSGDVLAQADLGGMFDVIFFNGDRQHLYVAIGDPGLIEVFETDRMRRLEPVRTAPGAHTLGCDPIGNTVYALLPETHRAVIYADRP